MYFVLNKKKKQDKNICVYTYFGLERIRDHDLNFIKRPYIQIF